MSRHTLAKGLMYHSNPVVINATLLVNFIIFVFNIQKRDLLIARLRIMNDQMSKMNE